jgi:aspartyl aminopeptidase
MKFEKKNVMKNLKENEILDLKQYMEGYIDYLNNSKTEYKAVNTSVKLLEENGFVDISKMNKLKVGDKVYFINKDKCLYIAVIGKKDIKEGLKILGAHIDSPRLDLKPMPMYENKGVCLLKTQYYGGIKKYQWVTIPLSMYGIIYNSKGEKLDIVIGEDDKDPVFTINDLLPHLANDQMKAIASDFIDPEKLNITFGSGEDKEIKNKILDLLEKKYGINEIDFARSEISFVPNFKARYVGIDSSMIGSYGQDDRVCAYASLKAIIDVKDPEYTSVTMLVDKEEIGSLGNTSMRSNIFDMFINKLIKLTNSETDLFELYYNSKMISADVSTCIDPCYEEVSDIQNANMLGYGVCFEKYTGGGGKSGASDANASYMNYIMNNLDKNNIIYQMGTLGKIGKGGGGTIAHILAEKGIDVVDMGTPILSMHSPFEVASVGDVYMTYKAYLGFIK